MKIALISVHGLIRGRNLELGRDADTGGQTSYVVELLAALAARPDIEQVDLFTRRIEDPAVDAGYAQPVEPIADNARIVRLPAGPGAYIRKEELWDHLDAFTDNMLAFLNEQPSPPDIVHGHYADAGLVGCRLAHVLGAPLVFTGHSLGRVKRRRLLAAGMTRDEIEQRFSITRRIEAEEETLATADLVVASTQNEIKEQYSLYNYYQPETMAVVPPGVDLSRFHPAERDERDLPVAGSIARFLAEPDKPWVLALSRPDERKNIGALVEAFGLSADLRKRANLVIVAGNRDDVRDLEEGAQKVLADLLLSIDAHDLYGRVAYPKHHRTEDVPVLYRLAAATGGVFVNPAYTEPFGLTLLEAAASGLPIVATEDGGPRDIIDNCRNGLLVDPLDPAAIAGALLRLLIDRREWKRCRQNGLANVERFYSWESHAESYLRRAEPIRARDRLQRPVLDDSPMLYHDRALFSDLDQNLLGDASLIPEFAGAVRENRNRVSFGLATGRRLDSALKAIRENDIPFPDVLITSTGTEIHYGRDLTPDTAWSRHIERDWHPNAVRRALDGIRGLEFQPKEFQSRFKVSYFIDPGQAPPLAELVDLMHRRDVNANAIMSFGQYLDVLPVRASKGIALRYVATQWDIQLERVLVAGGSGADEDMMRGNTLAVVVANRHDEELSQLTDMDRIYFATKSYAAGVLEAIEHYDFFGECRAPEDAAPASAGDGSRRHADS